MLRQSQDPLPYQRDLLRCHTSLPTYDRTSLPEEDPVILAQTGLEIAVVELDNGEA